MALPTRKQIEDIITANKGVGKSVIITKIQEYLAASFSGITDEEKNRILDDLNSYYSFTLES